MTHRTLVPTFNPCAFRLTGFKLEIVETDLCISISGRPSPDTELQYKQLEQFIEELKRAKIRFEIFCCKHAGTRVPDRVLIKTNP